MPRLTPTAYLRHRNYLARLWIQSEGDAFAFIPTSAQRDLHDYFALTVRITNDEALEHRAAMTEAFPSLPSQAGRAYVALKSDQQNVPNQMVRDHLAARTSTYTSGKTTRSLRVLAIARPEIDHRRLARALLALATNPKASQKLDRVVVRRQKHR